VQSVTIKREIERGREREREIEIGHAIKSSDALERPDAPLK